MLSNFQKRDARTPYIRRNRIALPSDTFRGHIITRANKRIRISLRPKLTTDSKITQLDLSVPTEKDVARFDVSMYDLLAMEVGETVENSFCDLAEDFLAGSSAELLHFAIDGVEGAAFAELHGDADGCCGGLDEGSVVAADVIAGAVFIEAELPDNLFLDVWVWVGCDDLVGKSASSLGI